VLAGTIFSDRELFEPMLDLAVYLSTPPAICAERVYKRELTRWGVRVQPRGDMYKKNRFHGDFEDYVANANNYETAEEIKFGRKMHEKWAAELPCPLLRLDGTKCIPSNIELIMGELLGN